jgi:hypothetical protein
VYDGFSTSATGACDDYRAGVPEHLSAQVVLTSLPNAWIHMIISSCFLVIAQFIPAFRAQKWRVNTGITKMPRKTLVVAAYTPPYTYNGIAILNRVLILAVGAVGIAVHLSPLDC